MNIVASDLHGRNSWPTSRTGISATTSRPTPSGRRACAKSSSTAISRIKDSTKGDYVAHVIRHNGKKMKDEVQQWHVHDCTFQMVYVMNGWATFEYAGQGVRTIRKGDCINQRPGIPHREIACSEDFEVLEIVAPADFKTRVVEGPDAQQQAAE